jgi:hypothetical protein
MIKPTVVLTLSLLSLAPGPTYADANVDPAPCVNSARFLRGWFGVLKSAQSILANEMPSYYTGTRGMDLKSFATEPMSIIFPAPVAEPMGEILAAKIYQEHRLLVPQEALPGNMDLRTNTMLGWVGRVVVPLNERVLPLMHCVSASVNPEATRGNYWDSSFGDMTLRDIFGSAPIDQNNGLQLLEQKLNEAVPPEFQVHDEDFLDLDVTFAEFAKKVLL